MPELERLKAENGDLLTRAEEAELRAVKAEAREAFRDMGAKDVKSVELHWLALTPDERAKTTHEDFIKGLKKTNPNLFEVAKPRDTGSNPRSEGGTPPGPAKMPVRPKTREDKKLLDTGWNAMKGRNRS